MRRSLFLILIVILLLAFAPTASAAVITFASGDGVGEYNDATGTNVVIAPDPVWVTSYEWDWISGWDSGAGGYVINNTVPGIPTIRFFKNFYLPGNTNTGSLFVVADDTARVLVNGIEVMPPNYVLGDNCAAGQIGCLESTGATIALTSFMLQGWNQIIFEAYQRGGGPFGLGYLATIESVSSPEVPEPATFAMLGLGLITAGFVSKFRKWSQRKKPTT